MTTPTTPRSAESIFEHIFTTANPETASQPPEHLAWVMFENGTAFFTKPTEELTPETNADALVEAARKALDELGPVAAGGPGGDFNVSLLNSWFPDEFVYFVTFGHPALATIVIADADNELAAGLDGRGRRDSDVRGKKVTLVRTFDGTKIGPGTR